MGRVGGFMLGGLAHVKPLHSRAFARLLLGGFTVMVVGSHQLDEGGVCFGGFETDEYVGGVVVGGSDASALGVLETATGGVVVKVSDEPVGTIATECSERLLPEVMYFRVVGGACAGLYPFPYQPGNHTWSLQDPLGSCAHPEAATIILQCLEIGWNLDVSVNIQGYPPDSQSDDPFVLIFERLDLGTCDCGVVTIIISDRFIPPPGDFSDEPATVLFGGNEEMHAGIQWIEAAGGTMVGGVEVTSQGSADVGGVVGGGSADETSGAAAADLGGAQVGGSFTMLAATTATETGGVRVGGSFVEDADMIPVGTILQFAANVPPSGWLVCNGQTVAKATYPLLWAAIGDNFVQGSALANDFYLPNFRGRCPVGLGQGTGLTTRVMGEKGGAETHTLTTAEMPSHTHAPTGGTLLKYNGSGGIFNSTGGAEQLLVTTLNNTGGGGSHNNMQPWLGVQFIIKCD